MSKKAKLKKNLDPFTSGSDIQKGLTGIGDKKKSKRTPQEKNRRERHLQKEIVRHLTDELVKLSDRDIMEDSAKDQNPHNKSNEIVYTIRPVKAHKD